VAAAAVISARGPDPDAVPTVETVEGRVMSTWCPGLTLAECPSAQAAVLRQRIAARVAEGWTNRRIDAWLVGDYGEGVLGRPRSAAAFLVPAAAVLLGGLAVALVVRGRPGDTSSSSPVPAPGSVPASGPAGAGAGPGGTGTGGAGAAPAGAGAGAGASDAERKRLEADLRRFAGEATE
jgi:cytochrome c-type biogenesis protein CcmH/NrfF